MKANELRIGNYVHFPSISDIKFSEVETIIKLLDGCMCVFLKNVDDVFMVEEITPIPLTAEWFTNFGFTTDDVEWNKDDFRIGIYKSGFRCIPFNRTMSLLYSLDIDIKYVNQLQNLYFTLTGEELTMKV